MKKNNNYSLKTIYFTLIYMFLTLSLYAQTQTEAEVKTSKNYYWAQYVGETEEEAKSEARTELIHQITLDISNNNKLNVKSDILIKGINYLVYPRGPKIRVVSYVLKEYVTNMQEGHRLDVVQLLYTEDVPKKDVTTKSDLPNAVKPPEVSISKKQENFQKEQPPEKEPVVQKHEQVKVEINNKTGEENALPVAGISVPTKPAESINIDNQKDFINFLINKKNIADIDDVMKHQKYKGLLNYGIFNSSTLYPEKCYLLVFDPANGNIDAFLDKGAVGTRMNLLTEKYVNDYIQKYQNMKIVWIQIY